MQGSVFGPDPRTLLRVSTQIDGGDGPEWVYSDSSDIDGDGLPDLVRHKGEDGLQVFFGRDEFAGGKPSMTIDVAMPEQGQLMVHDLTGDGRADVLLWGPGVAQGTVLIGR
jgi:hypothetical protein